jgi:very-short-patch-repair endonuclease
MDNLGGSERDHETLDWLIGALATSQFGVFSRFQALEEGATPRQIQHRLAQGRWDSPLPRVYRIVGAAAGHEQSAMAATLWAGDGAMLSHAAAGRLWGIDGIRGTKPELWVPSPRNPRTPGIVIHRGLRLDRADRTTLGPIPITTPVRTLIDVAGRLEDERLTAAMESVFRKELGTPERLAARLRALRESGRPGAGRLEELLRARGAGALESSLEAKVWTLLCRSTLPRPVRQHWVRTPGGPYRLDFAWPRQRLALEADSWQHHGDRVSFGKDRARLSEMVAIRWRVLVVTWDACTTTPRRVLRWVESALQHTAA